METTGRILCLDWGEKRIGAAISDEGRVFAFPFATIENDGVEGTLERLKSICEREGVGLVLVGLPLTGRGEVGRQALVVANFTDALRDRLGVPIEFVDERFSTQAALRASHAARRAAQRSTGTRSKDRHEGVVDQHAAQVVLQTYLDAHRPPTAV